MKMASWVMTVAGILVFAGAVYGRFHGPSTVALAGRLFSASSLVLVANTLILLGIVAGQHEKK